MTQYVYVKGGTVINRVEYGTKVPPKSEEDYLIFPATGLENAGDAFDEIDALKTRWLNKLDPIVVDELFRLHNLLKQGPKDTLDEYLAQLKAKM